MKSYKASVIFSIRMISVKQSQHQDIVIGDLGKSSHTIHYNRFHILIESKICLSQVDPWLFLFGIFRSLTSECQKLFTSSSTIAVAPLYQGSSFILKSPKIESRESKMCQFSFQYHILKMNGYPSDEPVAILAVFMIEIQGEFNFITPLSFWNFKKMGKDRNWHWIHWICLMVVQLWKFQLMW